MPNESEILDRLRAIVAEHYEVDESMIERHCNFYEDFGGDIIVFLELINKVEDEFEIRIPESCAKRMRTVNSLVKYISSKR